MRKLSGILVISSFCFFSCDQLPTFSEPQPQLAGSLKTFPAALQGVYTSIENNSRLDITPNLITMTDTVEQTIHKDSLPGNCVLIGSKIIDTTTGETIETALKGDSLLTRQPVTDTFFYISENTLVKTSHNYYYLNIKIDSREWLLGRLSLCGDQLTMSSFSDLDTSLLRKVTGKADISYPVDLTPAQFHMFELNNGFPDKKKYLKRKCCGDVPVAGTW